MSLGGCMGLIVPIYKWKRTLWICKLAVEDLSLEVFVKRTLIKRGRLFRHGMRCENPTYVCRSFDYPIGWIDNILLFSVKNMFNHSRKL